MSKIIEIVAMLLGGLSLLAVSFVGFSVLSGAPLQDVAVIGGMFATEDEDGAKSNGSDAAPATPPEPEKRSNTEVVEASIGSMGAWSLPSPFTQTELKSLADEMKGKLRRLDLREAELDQREKEVLADQELIAERFESLETMRKELEAFKAELTLREQEVLRDESAAQEEETARWGDVARVIAALEDEAAGLRLASFPPDDAASILVAMDPERAAELLNQLEGDRWKDYVEAYTEKRVKARLGAK